MPSVELLRALRQQILNEQEKRAKQRGWPLGDARTVLYAKLDQMRQRRFGDRKPPPPSAEAMADLEQFMREFAVRTGQRKAEDEDEE